MCACCDYVVACVVVCSVCSAPVVFVGFTAVCLLTVWMLSCGYRAVCLYVALFVCNVCNDARAGSSEKFNSDEQFA